MASHNSYPYCCCWWTIEFWYNREILLLRKGSSTLRVRLMMSVVDQYIGQRPFDSRLYLDISRSFKWKESFIFRYCEVFQMFQIFTCGLSDLLLLAVGSLVVFVLREYILKVHILVSSEHELCQILNTCIMSYILLFKTNCWYFFLTKLTILIIEYSSVVTVAESLDGSFESQSRLYY